MNVNSLHSQNQNRFWYFGQNLCLDFGTNLNTPLASNTSTPNSNSEGVATISDEFGNFLFYTDGIDVIDQNMSIVYDGIYNGNPSSSQSGIIVPSPCSCENFYVFTVGAKEEANTGNSLQYFTVNASNGSTLTATSSNVLTNNCYEKVTAIPHSNGTDYWILSIISNTQRFATYRLHCNDNGDSQLTPYNNGTDPLGEQSVSGASLLQDNGYLKGSPNGEYLAAAFSTTNSVDLYDFDPSTGTIVSRINTWTNIRGAYGIEFSPNSNHLFWSTWGSTSLGLAGTLSHYNILSSTLNPIITIPFSNAPTNWYEAGALQLSPDNSLIYVALPATNRLGSFNPSILNPLSSFNPNAISFTTGNVRLGLPNIISKFNICEDSNKQCCEGKNLIQNGDFENGNSAFSNDYMFQPDISQGSIIPGQYGVINGGQAATISSTWSNVQDPSTCSNSNGNFLIVNGENGGGSNPAPLSNSIEPTKVLWEQNNFY